MRRPLQLALALVPACSPASGKPDCGFGSFLHLLYVIAAILAVILVAVVALAIYLYRKNERSEDDRP